MLNKIINNKNEINGNTFNSISIELGNTTTKCIITKTNLENGTTTIIQKNIKKTNEIRYFFFEEEKNEIFGYTIGGMGLSEKAISKFITNIIKETISESKISIENIHFVARSTGILTSRECLDCIIKSLTSGCFNVGFSANQMTGLLNKKNEDKFKKYKKEIDFIGHIAGTNSPYGLNKSLILNEMEGEIACAGIKDAALNEKIDFRNPCIAIDMGTSLSGRIINRGNPYASAIGNFYGYSGIIGDCIIEKINEEKNKHISMNQKNIFNSIYWFLYKNKIIEEKNKIMDFLDINIFKCEKNRNQTKLIDEILNLNKQISKNVKLIYCDSYSLDSIADIGLNFYENYGTKMIPILIDEIMSDIVLNLIKITYKEQLFDKNMKIGITGRAGITGLKKILIKKKIKNELKISNKIIFIEDGFARGASVIGRCINSIGVQNNPIGGNSGDKCIFKKRKLIENKL